MKRTILFALLSVVFLLPSQAEEKNKLKFVDATGFTILNRTQPDAPLLQRLDVDKYPQLPPKVNQYFTYTTGLAVGFRTNSRDIHARWTTTDKATGVNTTLINQSGMDLYIRRGDEWVFAGIGTPTFKNTHQSPVVEHMEEGVKECILYLPLFNKLTTLELGIDEGAFIEALPNPFHRKIVVIGSSITHGASASRPGLAYPAMLNRAFGFEFTNLGACGLCRLDDFYAQIACDSEADAFLFDAFSNPSAQQIEERLLKFVTRIREKHPETPLIFLQTEVRETTNFDLYKRSWEEKKRNAAVVGMEKVMKAGYKNVYFINPGMILGDDHEGTTDGVHPNDAGFERIVKALQPKLKKIFRKHGIK